MRRERRIRQRELFDPDGPNGLLDGDRGPELVRLLAALLQEAATGKPMATEGGIDEQDHG